MPPSLNFLSKITSGLISIWRLTEIFISGKYYWGKKVIHFSTEAKNDRELEQISMVSSTSKTINTIGVKIDTRKEFQNQWDFVLVSEGC